MDENKKKIAVEALKALNEIEASVRTENLIKDNKIEFVVAEKTYRVRKPSFLEKKEIETIRRKEYLRLISDDSYLFRKTWIEKYKTKGININEKEAKVKSLQEDIKTLLLRLATAESPKDIKSLKDEINRLRDEQMTISMEITDLCSFSIEDQLTLYVNKYATYLVLEVKSEPDWKRVYDTYDEFSKSEDKVISEAFYYISFLMYNYTEPEQK
jgi:hypothetical protein